MSDRLATKEIGQKVGSGGPQHSVTVT